MKSRAALAALPFFALAGIVRAAIPWHPALYLPNGGYWPERAAITITNASAEAVAGRPLAILIPALAGARVESLRISREDGVELLFDVRNADGTPKHAGSLGAQDRLIVPVECAAGTTTNIYVYAGNPAAWAVPDFLPGKVADAALPEPRGLSFNMGVIERLELKPGPPIAPKRGPDWRNRAEVCARNPGAQPIGAALVRVNLRKALVHFPGLSPKVAVRVASAEGVELSGYRLEGGPDLLFRATLNPMSEQLFQLGFRADSKQEGTTNAADYEALLASGVNLVANGSFEDAGDSPDGWVKPARGGPHQVVAGFSKDARFGKQSLELTVLENAKGDWLGWNSREIPIKAGATYFLSGWIKAVELGSWATIHAHFHDARGALTRRGAMVSTQPTVSANSGWVSSRGFFQAPPDAATIQLQLTMNTHGTLRHDGVVLCEVLEGELTGVQTTAGETRSPGLQAWEVNPLVKVFPDTPAQTSARAVSVELARNEYEPFQLALRSSAATSVSISVSPLKSRQGDSLPAVRVDRVGFVPVDYPSAYYSTDVPEWCRKVPRGAAATDGWAGWWPDPLAPCESVALQASRTQPVWFTVHVPKSANAGNYRAEVILRGGSGEIFKIPLTVRVLPFALPDQGRLHAIFDFRFGPGGGFGSAANSPEARRNWLRFIAEHRLGIDAIHPAPQFSYKDGKVIMDAAAFDEAARYCFEELGMNVAYTPQFFYMFGWAYPPKKLFGLDPFTPEWTSAFQQAYRLFAEHVREKGWHDKFVYYISDEPHFQHEFVVEQMKRLCDLIHQVDPLIPIYSSTWRHCPAWDSSLDLWGIGQYGCFPVVEMERLQQAGKQMWFTCDGQMATDTPYLATERLLPYYCFKYGVRGFEFWGLAWWTYDPWQTGWHQFIRQSDEGKNYYWVRYPDGDGFLAYPGKPVGVDGPVSTIRLEQVREGLEDYEALALLADLAARARKAGKPSARAEQALAWARDLVAIPNAGGLRSTEILSDPDRVPAARRAVNAALVSLTPRGSR